MTAVLILLAGLVLTAAIIAVNGYFVAQEFAYMSVDRVRLRARAADGDVAAKTGVPQLIEFWGHAGRYRCWSGACGVAHGPKSPRGTIVGVSLA